MANKINYLSSIQTGQTIQAVHVNQFVDALSGSAAYDLVTSGSYTIIGPLNATASWATNALNANSASVAVTSTNATKISLTNNYNTNQEYNIVYASTSSATYEQLYKDDGSTMTYNPSTDTLTVDNIAGTASWATNAVSAPVPLTVKGTAYPSGSASIPNSLFQFIAGASQTGNIPNTVAITIGELTGKTLGQDCFVTATCSGSAGVGNGIVVNSLVGNVLTFESQAANTDFYYTVMYY